MNDLSESCLAIWYFRCNEWLIKTILILFLLRKIKLRGKPGPKDRKDFFNLQKVFKIVVHLEYSRTPSIGESLISS